MNEGPEIELVRRAWYALMQGGPEVLSEVLAPDARWYGVGDGQLCAGRKAIVDVMSRNLAGRLRGRIEETIQDGSRVIVAFRPEQPARLDDGGRDCLHGRDDPRRADRRDEGVADKPAAMSYAQNGK
jgi:hypothetical protein